MEDEADPAYKVIMFVLCVLNWITLNIYSLLGNFSKKVRLV